MRSAATHHTPTRSELRSPFVANTNLFFLVLLLLLLYLPETENSSYHKPTRAELGHLLFKKLLCFPVSLAFSLLLTLTFCRTGLPWYQQLWTS